MSGSFQGLGNKFLVFLARTSASAPQDLGVRRLKAAQKLGVFVVDIVDFVLTKKTVFFFSGIHRLEGDVFHTNLFFSRRTFLDRFFGHGWL